METESAQLERILMETGQITSPLRPEIDLSAGIEQRLNGGRITEQYLWFVAYKCLEEFWTQHGNPLVCDLPRLYQECRDAKDFQVTWDVQKQFFIMCDGAKCYFREDIEAQTAPGYEQVMLPLKRQADHNNRYVNTTKQNPTPADVRGT
jgi:hypothetical protein